MKQQVNIQNLLIQNNNFDEYVIHLIRNDTTRQAKPTIDTIFTHENIQHNNYKNHRITFDSSRFIDNSVNDIIFQYKAGILKHIICN